MVTTEILRIQTFTSVNDTLGDHYAETSFKNSNLPSSPKNSVRTLNGPYFPRR